MQPRHGGRRRRKYRNSVFGANAMLAEETFRAAARDARKQLEPAILRRDAGIQSPDSNLDVLKWKPFLRVRPARLCNDHLDSVSGHRVCRSNAIRWVAFVGV